MHTMKTWNSVRAVNKASSHVKHAAVLDRTPTLHIPYTLFKF